MCAARRWLSLCCISALILFSALHLVISVLYLSANLIFSTPFMQAPSFTYVFSFVFLASVHTTQKTLFFSFTQATCRQPCLLNFLLCCVHPTRVLYTCRRQMSRRDQKRDLLAWLCLLVIRAAASYQRDKSGCWNSVRYILGHKGPFLIPCVKRPQRTLRCAVLNLPNKR